MELDTNQLKGNGSIKKRIIHSGRQKKKGHKNHIGQIPDQSAFIETNTSKLDGMITHVLPTARMRTKQKRKPVEARVEI